MTGNQVRLTAVLVAAGRGVRFGNDGHPKQFLELQGRPLYRWSLDTLLNHPSVERIVLVVPAGFEQRIQSDLAKTAGFEHGTPSDTANTAGFKLRTRSDTSNTAGFEDGTRSHLGQPDEEAQAAGRSKPERSATAEGEALEPPGAEGPSTRGQGHAGVAQRGVNTGRLGQRLDVITGGDSRQESVFNALSYLYEHTAPEHVLIHDAVRPLLTRDIIDRVAAAMVQADACTVGVPIFDTVKRISDGVIGKSVPREELCLVQTPQAARFDLLYQAHVRAKAQQVAATDDTSLLQSMGVVVRLVPGSKFNLKVTEPDDLAICELLLTRLQPDLV